MKKQWLVIKKYCESKNLLQSVTDFMHYATYSEIASYISNYDIYSRQQNYIYGFIAQ